MILLLLATSASIASRVGAQTPASVVLSSPSSVCDADVTLRVTVNAPSATLPATIQFTSSMPSVVPAPPPLVIPPAQTTGSVPLRCVATTQAVAVNITASIGASAQSALLNVLAPVLESVNLKPVFSAVREAPVKAYEGSVRLAGPAPAGGVIVTLGLSVPTTATIPGSVVVPAGATSVRFDITNAQPVNQPVTVVVTATGLGTTRHTTFTSMPAAPKSLLLAATSSEASRGVGPLFVASDTLNGGQRQQARVIVNDVAGPGGLQVSLSSSNSSVLTVPSSVRIAANDSVGLFEFQSVSTAETSVITLTAAVGSISKTATITISGTKVTVVSVPSPTPGGMAVQGEVSINSPAPAGGTVVRLTSSSLNAVVPATVTVAAGNRSAAFPITTKNVDANTSATITATMGSSALTASMVIAAEGISDFTVSSTTLPGGTAMTGRLHAPTGHNGFMVTLASPSADLIVPATITFAPNDISRTFAITSRAVRDPVQVRVIAKVTSSGARAVPLQSLVTTQISLARDLPTGFVNARAGSPSIVRTAEVTVVPPTIQSLEVAPGDVVGGSRAPITATIRLSGPAPESFSVSVSTSSDKAGIASRPIFAAGSNVATFTLNTVAVSSNTEVTISAETQHRSVMSARLRLSPRP